MVLRKWNYEKQEYEPYEIPDDWDCRTYCADMEQIVNCPHCGKKLEFGDTYTSRVIHTLYGMGFGVCQKCYEKEWREEKSYKDSLAKRIKAR